MFPTVERSSAQAKWCRCQVKVRAGDATRIDLPDESVDMVLCHQLLHHLVRQEEARAEIHRVLEPGGALLLAESCREFILSPSRLPETGTANFLPGIRRYDSLNAMNFTPKSPLLIPLRVMAILCLLGALVVPAYADSEGSGEYVGTLLVPGGASQEGVQQAIVNALIGRGWNVKSRSRGVVVGYLKRRSNEATVTLAYSGSKIEIHCVGWAINKRTGERRRPEQPRGWLKFLQEDLTKHLILLATDE